MENKTSPLALLAATCSSIGRNDTDKGKESIVKTISPKASSKTEDSKSSFKPYKQELKFSSLPKPHTEGAVTSSTPTTPYGFSYCHGRFPPGALQPPDVEKERHGGCIGNGHYEANRDMNMHSLMKCHPPANVASHKSSPYVPHEHECAHCNSARGMPIPQSPRGANVCPCSFCNQLRPSADGTALKQSPQHCQMQSLHQMYPHLKNPSSMICRDPHCQNCTIKYPQSPSVGLQNYIHPALVHQCTHSNKSSGLPTNGSPNVLPSDIFMKPKPPISASHPFICNWVSDSKHCGKSFISSEELLQHLRTHTSLAHSQSRSPCDTHDSGPSQVGQAVCNIHGCPCRLGKNPGRQSTLPSVYGPYPSNSNASIRYHPYNGLGAKFGGISGPEGAYSSYLPHGMIHY